MSLSLKVIIYVEWSFFSSVNGFGVVLGFNAVGTAVLFGVRSPVSTRSSCIVLTDRVISGLASVSGASELFGAVFLDENNVPKKDIAKYNTGNQLLPYYIIVFGELKQHQSPLSLSAFHGEVDSALIIDIFYFYCDDIADINHVLNPLDPMIC